NSAIDGRTDLFSLATIVYEMLTGKGVFMGDTLAELCTKVLYHTPPPLDQVLPSVPRPIALAVSMALSKEPAARQAEIGLFADAVVGSSSPPSASSGFSPTLASNVASLASLQARALAAETQALAPVPVDASDVVTRSERPSLPAQSQPARAGTKRMIAAASAGILLLLGSVAWWQVRRDHATTPRTQALELPHTTAVSAPPALPSRAARPPADELAHGEPARTQPAVEPNTPAATRDTLSGPDTAQSRGAHGERAAQGKVRSIDPGSLTAKTEETGSRTRASEPERTLPASAKAALDDAERALQQGDVVNALRLARSSLRETSSERAYLLMARAYCRQRDVGMVQAMLRNLSPARRLQVQADCQSHGLTVP
ncbi:MAG: serine/threonine-protein kinase, partial [Myxococcaceae bacterium]|nr:serine/threonine-protein kinase [Myxococcaceae bacterium]